MDQAAFAKVVALMEPPAADSESSSTPSAQDDPDNPIAPAESGEPGQDTLPPEETPESDGDTPPLQSEETEPDLSQADNADLAEALKGLNPDAQEKLIEMAQAIAKGETSLGELKRGHKLGETVAQLKQQLEELQQQREEGRETAIKPSSLPEPVAKLKTLDQVKAHAQTARDIVRKLERFVRQNPEGGEWVDGKTYTADQYYQAIDRYQAELDALPDRAQQIHQQEQVSQVRSQAKQMFEKEFVWARDDESPQMKEISERLKAVPWLNEFPEPRMAAHQYNLAEAAVNAELAAKKTPVEAAKAARDLMRRMPWLPKVLSSPEYAAIGKGNGARATGATLQGKVPLGKPHSAAGAAAPRAAEGASVKSALDAVSKNGDRNSLAALLAATGR